jgi:hypothetical protein
MWAVYGGGVLLGAIDGPADDPSAGETWWTFGLESFVFMAGLVLLPLWLGRLARIWRPAE